MGVTITKDYTDGTVTSRVSVTNATPIVKLEQEVDCATNILTTGQYGRVINLPKGFMVTEVQLEITTAETGTADIGIMGDDDDAEIDEDGFLDGVDTSQTAGTIASMVDGSTAYATGKLMLEDAWVNFLAKTADLNSFVGTVRVYGYQCETY